MKLRAKYFLMGASSGWLLASSAQAFVAPERVSSLKSELPFTIEHRVVRPATIKDTRLNERLDALTTSSDRLSGAVRLVSGNFDLPRLDVQAGGDAFAAQALAYLDANPDIFGVTSADVKLVPAATLMSADVQFLKFHVYRDGLLVSDASIDFRFKRGKLVQVSNQSYGEAIAPPAAAPRSDLEATVAALTDANSIKAQGSLYRVEQDSAAGVYRLVKVESFTVESELGTLTAEIAANSGKLFEVRDNNYHYAIEVTADAYPRWYDDELATVRLDDIAVDTDTGTIYPMQGDDPETKANPRIDGLNGRYVKVSSRTGNDIAQSAELVDGSWQIHFQKNSKESAWIDKTMAQLMVYIHTTAINHKAKEYIQNSWLDKQLPAFANLSRSCNAHWDGNSINFYSGSSQCANTGLIADVIYHEWGHGLDAMTGGIDDGAFSEGYGDILALVMTHSNLLGVGFKVSDRSPVRDLEPDRVYPDDRGEVHSEGLIIGSTFWDLFKALSSRYNEEKAGQIVANYAFKMIYTARSYTDVYDALKVIDDDDDTLENGTPNLCLINEAFAKHGLAEKDDSCKLATVDAYQINDADGDGVIEPGESVTITANAHNTSSRDLDGLKGELSITEGKGVTVTDSELLWESIPSQTSAMSHQGANLRISRQASCGSSFTTKLVLTAPGGEATLAKTFTIGRNAGEAELFTAADLPLPTKDRATVKAPITIAGDSWKADTKIAAAHLKFEITHSYVGDLVVSLVSPNDKAIEIYRGRGSADNVSYDQDISSLLAGETGEGTWTLSIYDKARRDSGQLDQFALTLTPSSFICD